MTSNVQQDAPSTKHTAEPWQRDGLLVVVDGAPHPIAGCWGMPSDERTEDPEIVPTEGLANAARIVACVNFCVAVPTLPAVKLITLLEALKSAAREDDARRAALAGLLAAAQEVLAGLTARIVAAPGDNVPVFDGIAELHEAIVAAKRVPR